LEPRLLLATAYYVSPSGDDTDSGTSPAAAWRTISRVNQATFLPGDSVLFQGGATFTGSLVFGPADAGTPTNPITISSYGDDRASINAQHGTGISLHDTQGFDIENLNIYGSGLSSNNGFGIYCSNDLQTGTLHHFHIDNVDASGFGAASSSGFDVGWGIFFNTLASGFGFEDVSVTNSSVHGNGYGGLVITESNGSSAQNVYVGHVQAHDNPGIANTQSGTGLGIYLAHVLNGTVERCEAYHNGSSPTSNGGGGGIGCFYCTNVVVQYNESYSNKSPHPFFDGDGLFLDATTGCVLQYNYSHNNDGAGFLIGPFDGPRSDNNTVRYNISESDSRRNSYSGIYVGGDMTNSSHTEVYNNTIYMNLPSQGTAAAMIVQGSVHARNNILQTAGGVPILDVFSPGSDTIFQGNDYWSSSSNFVISWGSTNYPSLVAWRNNTGQEKLNGQNVGLQDNPLLNNPGHGGTIGNADELDDLTAYQLQPSSPLRSAGLNLRADFGINPGPHDFYGDPIPEGSGYTIGAD
jgi:hypothetical protein